MTDDELEMKARIAGLTKEFLSCVLAPFSYRLYADISAKSGKVYTCLLCEEGEKVTEGRPYGAGARYDLESHLATHNYRSLLLKTYELVREPTGAERIVMNKAATFFVSKFLAFKAKG